MDCVAARGTQVVKLPGLVSVDEIKEVHEIAGRTGIVDCQPAYEFRGVDEKSPCLWKVLYLQTNSWFQSLLPSLNAKLKKAVFEADRQNWGLLTDYTEDQIGVRCVEYHRMETGGSLRDPKHYDLGSLLTLDVMLTRPTEDFEGGQFSTLEDDGSIKEHPFSQGDAVLFVSHKAHHVTPVTKGTRQVLVVEFWEGPDRTCPHRCQALGECNMTPQTRQAEEEQEFSDAFFANVDMAAAADAMRSLEEGPEDCKLEDAETGVSGQSKQVAEQAKRSETNCGCDRRV